jgi:hypothetical protein
VAAQITGVVFIVWGPIVVIRNEWVANGMSKIHGILYGERVRAIVTPRYIRLVGVFLAISGVAFNLIFANFSS